MCAPSSIAMDLFSALQCKGQGFAGGMKPSSCCTHKQPHACTHTQIHRHIGRAHTRMHAPHMRALRPLTAEEDILAAATRRVIGTRCEPFVTRGLASSSAVMMGLRAASCAGVVRWKHTSTYALVGGMATSAPCPSWPCMCGACWQRFVGGAGACEAGRGRDASRSAEQHGL